MSPGLELYMKKLELRMGRRLAQNRPVEWGRRLESLRRRLSDMRSPMPFLSRSVKLKPGFRRHVCVCVCVCVCLRVYTVGAGD